MTQPSLIRCHTIAWSVVLLMAGIATAQDTHRLQINVDDAAGNPLPCRIHLSDAGGKPIRAPGQPFWRDHFVCDGRVAVDVPAGSYRYEIERGPEHGRQSGSVTVSPDSANELSVNLTRIANLRQSGWYSGDLHVHRPVEEVELLMRAEDLDIAPVITWWNNRNSWKDQPVPAELTRRFDGHRIYNVMAGEDEREGGALLFFGLDRPLDIAGASREFPSPMQFVADAKRRNPDVWIDIEKPFWWDVPLWVASGQMQSIGIANNHMCRSRMLVNEAWGRPRDIERLPDPRGNGFWTQEIYYHLLDAGLRLPPSAGSASGVLPNPVGYNRVYVHLDDDQPFDRSSWFQALSQGRSFVTNGPLLVVRAGGKLPGHRFKIADDKAIPIQLDVTLTSLDRISHIEVVQNGAVTKRVPCGGTSSQAFNVTMNISADGAGWFLVRTIAEVDHTFRFASTAPWFVETEAVKHRISRRSAQFFLDWTRQRIGRVQAKVTDPERLRRVLRHHEQAEAYWQQRLTTANAP